jgi:hypothetical protein
MMPSSRCTDGTFDVANLPPGRYRISAREGPGGPWRAIERAGTIDIDVDGQDVGWIVIPIRPGSVVSGHVVDRSGGAAGRGHLVVLEPDEGEIVQPLEPELVNIDGTFRFAKVFGRRIVRLGPPRGGVMPRLAVSSVRANGVDVTGRAIEFDGQPVSLTVHVTTRLP